MTLVTTLLASLGAAASAFAQPISYNVLIDESHPQIRPTGDRPAFSQGTLAFRGAERSTGRIGIYIGPPSGPFAPIVRTGDPVPNNPGREFNHLQNPAVWNGTAYFDGGWPSSPPDGVYFGDAATFGVLVDSRAVTVYMPLVSADEGGILSKSVFADYSGATQFLITTYQPLPGGGTASNTSPEGDSYAMGGGRAVISRYASHASGHDVGIYTWSPADPQIRLVANWNNQIPGDGRNFEYFTSVDTDGVNVSFTGSHGFVNFGGIDIIGFTPALSGGSGPITRIAAFGDVSPDGRPYTGFQQTAIDGDTVYFSSLIGSSSNQSLALFMYRAGVVTPLLISGQVIGGKTIVTLSLTHKAVQRDRIVLRAGYEDPTAPWGVAYMLLMITTGVEPPPCYANCDGSTVPPILNVDDFTCFINAFAAGQALPHEQQIPHYANCDSSTIAPVLNVDDFTCFINAFAAGCP